MRDRQIALVTGATSGIGEACAHRFAAEGWDLIVTGRRSERLGRLKDRLETQYHIRVLPLVFDVRDRDAVIEGVGSIPQEWKEVDVLVNNAGLAAGREPIQDGLVTDWDQMIDTNLKGLLYVSEQVIPLMLERKKGHIINISSLAAFDVYPGGGVYCATKHAVKALSRGMRMDLVGNGIKVSTVSPGAVETEFSLVRFKGDKEKASKTYDGFQPLLAHDVADSVWFIASRPAHVNIEDIFILPSAQASAFVLHREEGD